MEDQNKPRVVVLPDELLSCKEDLRMMKLKHPRSGTPMLCVLGEDHSLYEIVDFKTKYSSWFIGDQVIEDGGFHMVTPIDPTFFILMYLNKEGKFCPFEDCIIDSEFPDAKYLIDCCTKFDFEQVANTKGFSDLTLYAFDKSKTLNWLKKKVEQSAEIIKSRKITVSDDAKAVDYNPTLQEEEKEKLYTEQSCRLMSEYLSEELSAELCKMFGVELEEEIAENGAGDGPKEKKFKGDDVISQTNGYSKENSVPEQDKKKPKISTSQKRLMKVDKSGMKNISSFFQKK